MHIEVDACITWCELLHMRTTITIAEDVLEEAQKLSGKAGYSDAIVSSLKDYIALRKRLALLEDLFRAKPPRSYRQVKEQRRARRWSS